MTTDVYWTVLISTLVSCSCPFQGSADEIAKHMSTCKFEGVKVRSIKYTCVVVIQWWLALCQGYLQQVEGEIKMLRGELEKKDETIQQLSSSVAELTTRIEEMEKMSSAGSHQVGQSCRPIHTYMCYSVLHAHQSIWRSSRQSLVLRWLIPRTVSLLYWWVSRNFIGQAKCDFTILYAWKKCV